MLVVEHRSKKKIKNKKITYLKWQTFDNGINRSLKVDQLHVSCNYNGCLNEPEFLSVRINTFHINKTKTSKKIWIGYSMLLHTNRKHSVNSIMVYGVWVQSSPKFCKALQLDLQLVQSLHIFPSTNQCTS